MENRIQPIDKNGLPGAIGEAGEFDGGDTAAIVGNILALKPGIITEEVDMLYRLIQQDAPVRHPDTTKWYGQTDRFSRDQLIPLICAGIRLGEHPVIDYIFKLHKAKKFARAWNTRKNGAIDVPIKPEGPDFTGPEILALWLRYKKPWWARLVLGILDIETLMGSLFWRFMKPKTDRVTRNHMLVSIISNRYMSTCVSRLAYRINNWQDLITRWEGHCVTVREYDTYTLFKETIKCQNK